MRIPSIFNRRAAVITSALAVALVAPALHAQDQITRSQITVPFAFEVGSARFSAGKYILDASREHILLVEGAKRSALAMTSYETSLNPASQSAVVFYRYGNQYSLREVWSRDDGDHLRCPESKAEQEIRRSYRAYARASLMTRTPAETAILQSSR
jgi:hypothetical protein